MAGYKNDEEARRNRLASMTDNRPEVPATGSARPNQYQGRTQLREACSIRVDRITPDPNQPRTEFDQEAMERLAASLRERGQLQPIRVRWDEPLGLYVVVLGERRWRAARLAGLESLTCVVVAGEPTAEDLLEDQLVENALREDLKPVEQAKAYRALMTSRGLTQVQLAERLHIGQGTVAKALALLTLPGPIQASVDAGEIGPDAAYQLTKVADSGEQAELAKEAAAGLLKRDELKERTRTRRKGRGPGKPRKQIERVFKTTAGPKITVEHRRGLDMPTALAALREAVHTLETELGAGDQAAA
ncbi:MAG TPA: ParB/RepB/Spo0J family partition protein [Isosphaeraceae bacterium]|nr:ParB/RepB/Spo0J family partition protein [Isosphaeraceae bacterium]